MRARRATPSRPPPRSRSRPAPELVAGGGRLDQPSDQPAAAKRERWEHVRAAIAPHPGRGRGLVVRLLLRKTPYPSRHPKPSGVRLPQQRAGGGCPVRRGTSRRRPGVACPAFKPAALRPDGSVRLLRDYLAEGDLRRIRRRALQLLVSGSGEVYDGSRASTASLLRVRCGVKPGTR
jgi:hypothetical protein